MYARMFNGTLPEPELFHGHLCPLGIQTTRCFPKRSQDGRRWSCPPQHCCSTSFQKRWNLDSRPPPNVYMYVSVCAHVCVCVHGWAWQGVAGWQLLVCGRRFYSPPCSWGQRIVSIPFAEDRKGLATKIFFFNCVRRSLTVWPLYTGKWKPFFHTSVGKVGLQSSRHQFVPEGQYIIWSFLSVNNGSFFLFFFSVSVGSTVC